MNEPKIIDFSDARVGDWLVSDGGSVRVKIIGMTAQYMTADAKPGGWQHTSLHWKNLGFHVEREDPPDPAIVKPVVLGWRGDCLQFTMYRTELPFQGEPHLVITIRPAEQQEELDRLEREFVESMEAKTIFDPTKAIALRDFIKKEQA